MAFKDPERKRQYHRDYNRRRYQENPEEGERQRTYRKAHLSKYAEYQRNQRTRNPRENLVYLAKHRAKRDGLPFNLSVETIEWPTHCPILGVELDYNKTKPGQRKARREFPT